MLPLANSSSGQPNCLRRSASSSAERSGWYSALRLRSGGFMATVVRGQRGLVKSDLATAVEMHDLLLRKIPQRNGHRENEAR